MKRLNIFQRLSPYGGVLTPSLNITVPPIPTYVKHGVRHAYLYASPKGQRMKAVLEFTYPQDEGKLKHALKGEDYYLTLIEVDRVFNIGGHPEQMLDRIADLVQKGLEE